MVFMPKTPSIVIYWADTKVPLNFRERKDLEFSSTVISVTPEELLLENMNNHRKVVIRGTTDPAAPKVPAPKAKEEGQ